MFQIPKPRWWDPARMMRTVTHVWERLLLTFGVWVCSTTTRALFSGGPGQPLWFLGITLNFIVAAWFGVILYQGWIKNSVDRNK